MTSVPRPSPAWPAWPLALALVGLAAALTLAGAAATTTSAIAQVADGERYSVLVLSRTTHHEDHRPSSNAGEQAINQMGIEGDFSVTWHEVPDQGNSFFTSARLREFDVVVFNNNGGANVLNAQQRVAFERWMQRGGGAVGIHGASNADTDWEWFDEMIGGAWFRDHPSGAFQFQDADIEVEDDGHPATAHLPTTWTMNDEWHAFHANPRENVHVLATLDESSYDLAGTQPMGDHPIVWCTQYDGGRHLYTGLAHGPSTWVDSNFLDHIEGAIEWAAGAASGDCGPERDGLPTESSLRKVSLESELQSPMSLEVADDGRVFFVELGQLHGGPGGPEDYLGRVKVYDPEAEETFVVGEVPVHRRPGQNQNGLLGIALDPSFDQTDRIYLFYSAPNPGGLDGVQHISRFTFDPDAGEAGEIDLDSEVVLLEVPHQRLVCCHSSGSLAFGPNGFLYASTGDDTEHSQSGGFAPMDQRPCGPGGWTPGDATCMPASWPEDSLYAADARRTSGNTADLRGKILRIKPIDEATPDDAPGLGSTYTVDDGNLFTSGEHDELFPGGEYDPELGRPEIYAMGIRNGFRFTIDPESGWIYQGEVGPDANNDSANRGPRGYDELNQIREAGNFGWPFCSADNKAYRQWTFPSGPAGDLYDCENGPTNDSDRNTGLDVLPPGEAPLLWYQYGGAIPEFPDIPLGSGRATFAGPLYRYDPELDSGVKLDQWFDGTLIWADWSRRWLAATTLDEQGDYVSTRRIMANETFLRTHELELGPDGALYIFEWGEDYNYAGTGINPDSGLYRIEQRKGDHPPVATASADRTSGEAPLVVDFTGELSDQGGAEELTYEWDFGDGETSEEANPTHTFTGNDTYTVTLTVSDSTTTDETELQITVRGEGCIPLYSDEFDGEELDPKWQVLRWDDDRDDPAVEDASLLFPLGQLGFDQDRPGPATILGQEMPDGDWEVIAKVAAPGLNADTGNAGSNYAKVGLIVFQENATPGEASKHWISYQHARNADGGATANTYFEATAQNGNGGGNWTLGARVGNASAATNLPTFWIRVTRTGDQIEGFSALPDAGNPDEPGAWMSLNTGAASNLNIDTIMPAGEGPIYIGPYGANGSITTAYDYVRFQPDEFDCDDVTAPVTSVELNGADPQPSYDGPVEVTLSATDGTDDEASGVERTSYRVDGGEWVDSANAGGEDPFTTDFTVSEAGEREVEYRSVDVAGNEEEIQSVAFEIGGEAQESCDVQANPSTWAPDHCDLVLDGEVTWHFDNPPAELPHDVWLIAPGGDPAEDAFEVTDGIVSPGGQPVDYSFDQQGTWTFYCSIHAFWDGEEWVGNPEPMVGTVDVGEPDGEPDTTPPVTTVLLNGSAPVPTYAPPVTVTFNATDPGEDASGVDFTEFRVDSDDEADWETYNPVSPPEVATEGEHTIDYRSHDNAGNVEETKTVTFTIDSDGAGEANLRVVGQPKKRTVGPKKKQTSFRLRATNRGDAPSGTVHLCAAAPKKRVNVLGQRCRTFENIDPGQTRQRPVKLRIKPKARGKLTKVKLIARGPDVDKRQATVRLQARK